MSKITYETVRDALVDWTYASGLIYLTDDEEGPGGIIAGENAAVSIKLDEDCTSIYYRGNEEDLEVLKALLFNVEGESVKLFVEGDDFFTKLVQKNSGRYFSPLYWNNRGNRGKIGR